MNNWDDVARELRQCEQICMKLVTKRRGTQRYGRVGGEVCKPLIELRVELERELATETKPNRNGNDYVSET